ncbi:MAG: hypothetical protein AB7P18_22130 [Candidatus Binatia bacterium]
MKGSFNIQLQGFPAANRDAIVKLTNQATGAVIERQPFLDGSLLVRDLDPGQYEVEVRHPNVITAIDRRRIRLFPQPTPTVIHIPVPADLFRDSPIRDIPDANLAPVQQTMTSVRDAVSPLAGKAPGEVIRASDWNALVGAVRDMASAVLELTQLVAPQGHDHPEIADKISEVQENIRRFAEAFGRSLVELRREIETENLRRIITGVLDQAQAPQATRTDILTRLDDLADRTQSEPPVFTQKLSATGSRVLSLVNELAITQDDPDAFLGSQNVTVLTTIAQQYAQTGATTQVDKEMQLYQRTGSVSGGQKITPLIRAGR